MLAKMQTVTKEGQLVKHMSKETKLANYATMMGSRIHFVQVAYFKLAMAVTIAIRYNCVRSQGYKEQHQDTYKADELPIIEYQI